MLILLLFSCIFSFFPSSISIFALEFTYSFFFSLIPSTIVGGAELDDTTSALVYVADSDDVYGIVNILAGDENEMFQGR